MTSSTLDSKRLREQVMATWQRGGGLASNGGASAVTDFIEVRESALRRRIGVYRGGFLLTLLALSVTWVFGACRADAAWRTGFGVEGGVQAEKPAAAVLLDFNAGPGSRIHWQPTLSTYTGVTDLGINVLVHTAECHRSSAFFGIGAGLAWYERPDRDVVVVVNQPPPPRHDPPRRDPAYFNALAGVRAVPGTMGELLVMGRLRVDHRGDATGGGYLVLIGHEPRKVVGP